MTPYLNGQTFAADEIATMNAAFVTTCKALNIAADSPTRPIIAQTIIGLLQEGHTDAERLAAAAITEIRGTMTGPSAATDRPRARPLTRTELL
jgi:hypothetical protein